MRRRGLFRSIVQQLADARGVGTPSDPLGVRITQQPGNVTVEPGTDVTFTVVATSGDASPLTYQWQELLTGVWTNLTNTGRISGVTTATLALDDTVEADTGRIFRVIVTNAVNSKFSISPVVVVATPEPVSNWILFTGFWNDAGEWDDSAVWVD